MAVFVFILIAGCAQPTGALACFYENFWRGKFGQNTKCRLVLSWPAELASDNHQSGAVGGIK
jgi:hypothetical protein